MVIGLSRNRNAGKGRVGSVEQRALAECASVVSAGREKAAGAQQRVFGRRVVGIRLSRKDSVAEALNS